MSPHALFLAQAPAPSAGPQSMIPMLAMPLLLIGLFFLMIGSQRKKQKEHDKMMAALQTGDEIVTSGGIYGVIANVKDDRFVLRVGDNVKIEVGKAFVQSVVKKTGEEKK